MEKENDFLHKVTDVLSFFSPDKDGPVVSIALHRRLLPPLCRVTQHQLDLYGLCGCLMSEKGRGKGEGRGEGGREVTDVEFD